MKIDSTVEYLNNIALSLKPDAVKQAEETKNDVFADFYKAALDTVNETNLYEQQSAGAQEDFLTGRSDNIIDIMLAQEKAYTSLQFTVQVTNKIVEAYREIMRIQL